MLINILKYETFFGNLQKYIGCISIGKQCFHHIHVPYAPAYSAVSSLKVEVFMCVRAGK
jgi:hypothetical protein